MLTVSSIPESDLEAITLALKNPIQDLKNAHIFLTGGTGFFGIWLIESFLAFNEQYQLDATLYVLSRDPERFLNQHPHFKAPPHLQFIKGDIKSFPYPPAQMTHIIHAATSANVEVIENNPLETLSTIVEGTERILNYCRSLKCPPKMLLTSSGAVYGKQPSSISHLCETMPTSPDLYGARSAYGLGKCMAEHLCSQYHRLYQLPVKVARCFAFLGPHLPLDHHFAIGNFIADRLAKRPILIKSQETVFRSYQYPSDLMIWLWTILISGQNASPYNVGSDEAHTLDYFATLISKTVQPSLPISRTAVSQQQAISRYVPSIAFAKQSLGLYNRIPIKDAILKTLAWHELRGQTHPNKKDST